jgi:hypothetical protein
VNQAADELTQAVQQGDVTPGDGESMMRILESRARLMEQAQWEGRVEQVEARMESLHSERSRETQNKITQNNAKNNARITLASPETSEDPSAG